MGILSHLAINTLLGAVPYVPYFMVSPRLCDGNKSCHGQRMAFSGSNPGFGIPEPTFHGEYPPAFIVSKVK
mgnify:CR=1 FL=1